MFISPRLRAAVVVALVVALTLGWTERSFGQEALDLNPGPANPNALGPAIPPELTEHAGDWPAPQGNLAGTRAATDAAINAASVAQLEVAWRFPIEGISNYGGMTAPPLVVGETVYVQDMQSNVFALDRSDGEVLWEKRYDIA